MYGSYIAQLVTIYDSSNKNSTVVATISSPGYITLVYVQWGATSSWTPLNISPQSSQVTNSIVVGNSNTLSAGVSNSVIAGGTVNSSSGSGCTLSGGTNNTVGGTNSTVSGGFFHSGTGSYSTICGGYAAIANGAYSTIVGGTNGSAKSIIGNTVIAANNTPSAVASTNGGTQTTILNVGCDTTDATATRLRTNASASSTTNQLILANNSASTFQGQVTALAKFALATTAASGDGTTATLTFAAQTAAPFIVGTRITVAGVTPTGYNTTTGIVTACTTTTVSYTNATTGAQTVAGTITGTSYTSAWTFTGAIMRSNNAAGTRIIGTPSINLVAQDTAASSWVLALTADTTNGGLAVTATGATGVSIVWLCTLITNEVTY